MSKNAPKILLLTSFIGSGHKRCAESIEEGIKKINPNAETHIVDFLTYFNPEIAEGLTKLYLRIIENEPSIWSHFYDPAKSDFTFSDDSKISNLLYLMRQQIKLSGKELLRFDRNKFERMLFTIYLRLALHYPEILGYFSDIGGKSEKIGIIHYFQEALLNILILKKFCALIEEFKPDAIVSTQLFPNMIMAKLKTQGKVTCPLIGVITDFGVHSFWVHKEIDCYVVGSEEVKEELIKYGIESDRINVYGIPISPNFAQRKNKERLREQFGLDDKKITILIMGGGVGIGITRLLEMEDYKKITKLPIQAIVVCGNNDKLNDEIQEYKSSIQIPIILYKYVSNIDEIMAVSDIIITKPGGLTVSESLASGLLIIILDVLPGQEEHNRKYLLKHKIAIDLTHEKNIADSFNRLIENQEELRKMRLHSRRLGKPRSAQKTASKILSLIEQQNPYLEYFDQKDSIDSLHL